MKEGLELEKAVSNVTSAKSEKGTFTCPKEGRANTGMTFQTCL